MINTIIVDDEPLAIEVIESYLKKINSFNIVAKCSDALKAFQIIQEKSIDLIFLDVQMPQMDGISFLRTSNTLPKVILTTAYREYAFEGFELDVLDYLLKPISFERFLKAINKFNKYHDLNPTEKNKYSDKEESVYLKSNRKILKLNLDNILFFEGMKDYVMVHLKESKISVKEKLCYLEEILPPEQFLRIHKSYFINTSKISSISANSIEIKNKELPIGRSYKNLVMQKLNVKL